MTVSATPLVQRVARCLSVSVAVARVATLTVSGAWWIVQFNVADRVLFVVPDHEKEFVR